MNAVTPPLLTLARYDDPSRFLEVEANPPMFSETYGTEWAKLKVPGLSHSAKQFIQTVDRAIQFKVEFFAIDSGTKGVPKLKAARKFLMSACRPRSTPGAIASAGAPLIVFFWPNFTTLIGNIESVNFTYNRFNRLSEPVEMTADIKMEEVRLTLITADGDDGADADPDDSMRRPGSAGSSLA